MKESPISPTVPFNDLGRGTKLLRHEIDAAISRVLSSGWYVLGPEHDGFEEELAAFVGTAHAIGVANGTDALQLALAALGVERGDAVLTAANAGGYASTAVRALGAIPVFTDIDSRSQLVTVPTLELAISGLSQKPKVVVVTHLFGAAAHVDQIVSWAREEGIRVLEDCAQSMGAIVVGKRVGSWGDIATTSFYPTKNLGALGDGGAVFTSDEDLAAHVRQLRQYGWSSKYRTTILGGQNSRLDEIQAAILRVKLPHLDAWNDKRRAIHIRYENAVSGSIRMVNHSDEGYVGHLAVLETEDRGRAQNVLAEYGVRTDVHYPIPDHKQPISLPNELSLPITELAAERILSVPLFPELTELEVDTVCMALSRI